MIIKLPSSGEFVNLDNFVFTQDRSLYFIGNGGCPSFAMNNEDTEFVHAVLTRISELNLLSLGQDDNSALDSDATEPEIINRFEQVTRSLAVAKDEISEPFARLIIPERGIIADKISYHEIDPDYDGELAW